MEIIAIKTRKFNPPRDNIYNLLDNFCPKLKENDILLITSKILAIHQGRCIKCDEIDDRDSLIINEADRFISRDKCPGGYAILTLKNNTLIASAGIDKSNSNGYYVLWPKNSSVEAKNICSYLKKKYSLKNFGVIITDSHSMPLRYGTLGISIGSYGIGVIKDYVGKKDIFGNILNMTQGNVVDALSVMGVFMMGEGNEQTPMVLMRDINNVDFVDEENYNNLLVPIEDDIYFPLLSNFFQNK